MRVHILLKCSNRDRIRSAMLVFKTLQIGFPNSTPVVYGNDLHPEIYRIISGSIGEFRTIPLHSKGQWIEALLNYEQEPFWLCDTDMVFFDQVDNWVWSFGDALFAGRFEPEFIEPWTNTLHMARLHPSLMWFNPVKLRCAMRLWPLTHEFFDSAESNLIRWHWSPERGKRLKFYDVCAGLYHALEGTPFNESVNKSFVHLHCGSYAEKNAGVELARLHDAVFDNPELARGLSEKQNQWYKDHSQNLCLFTEKRRDQGILESPSGIDPLPNGVIRNGRTLAPLG